MKKQHIRLHSQEDTAKLAGILASQLQPVDCLTLTGTLGVGKTTLVRYLLKNLGVKESVISPTFLLMQEYPIILPSGKETVLYHIDGYRIEDEREIPELGIEEIAENCILCVEWPEKFLTFLPKTRMDITLTPTENERREVTISCHGSTQQRGESLAATYNS